jgi:pimeloyl-ACP methyl ester carboxylesterase
VNSALLVHGLGRTPFSMFPLAGVVRRAGLRTHFFAYSCTFEPFDGIVRRLVGVLDRLRPQVLIAHSLGGLLCRLALAKGAYPEVQHLVMLGTPNCPPRLAAYFWKWWPFRAFAGTSGRFLAHPTEYDRLPHPTVPCTVVAGTAGPVGRLSPFGFELNDSIVSVGETELPGADHVLVPAWHTWMMAHRDVHAVVQRVISMCCSGMGDLPSNVNIAHAPPSAIRTTF